MKKLILSSAFIISSLMLFAQSEKYVAAMKTNIAAIDNAFKSPADLVSLANNFERIALAEKNQWLPYYYAALLQVNSGITQTDKSNCDAIADKSTLLLNKADSLSPNNSEISCVKSMIAICHMLVDPMRRYMEYGQTSATALQDAMTQDPTNPRPYYLTGQTLKNTPEQFGGGCKAATEQLNIALQKYAAFKPASELSPNWGMERAQKIVDECK
jgi:DNA uptake protein ComE-like DNA-binding protein